jgi:LuxR family maltose regulon positive regulatory protein
MDDLMVHVFRARLALAQGDLAAAERWAAQYCQADILAAHNLYLQELELVTHAWLLIAQDQEPAALELLKRLEQDERQRKRNSNLIPIYLLQGLAHHALGHVSLALDALKQAVALAEPQGYSSVFLEYGPPGIHLLREAIKNGVAPLYLSKVLASLDSETRPAALVPVQHLAEAPFELLSEREMEVLRLAAAGKSNQEIAEELVVAPSTIKTHINNIYRKLEVNKRTQAAARARQLGLL